MTGECTVTLTEAEAIELEMILEKQIAEAEKRLAFYKAERDPANGLAMGCCESELANCRPALAKLEAARTEGRKPMWPEAAAA